MTAINYRGGQLLIIGVGSCGGGHGGFGGGCFGGPGFVGELVFHCLPVGVRKNHEVGAGNVGEIEVERVDAAFVIGAHLARAGGDAVFRDPVGDLDGGQLFDLGVGPEREVDVIVEPEGCVAVLPRGAVRGAGIKDGGEEVLVSGIVGAEDGEGARLDLVEPGLEMVRNVHGGVGGAVHDVHGAALRVERVEDRGAVADNLQGAVGRALAGKLAGVKVAAGAVKDSAAGEDDGVD